MSDYYEETGNVVDNDDGTVTVTEYDPHTGYTHTYNMPNWYIGPEEDEEYPVCKHCDDSTADGSDVCGDCLEVLYE